MEMSCATCGSSRFRISRFRLSDLSRLLVFRYPVRCIVCQQRSHATLTRVLELRRKRAAKVQSRT